VKQKATAPVIAIAVIVLVGIVFLLFKQFGAPPSAGTEKTSPLPSFIDPVTKKPKPGMRGSSEGSLGGRPPGGGPPGAGVPGGGPPGPGSGGGGGQ
jgi:hypothetical protein